MMQVYLDNAATTPLDEQVLEAMLPFMKDQYGNPSSIHSHGRKVRSAIEQSRKQIADIFMYINLYIIVVNSSIQEPVSIWSLANF